MTRTLRSVLITTAVLVGIRAIAVAQQPASSHSSASDTAAPSLVSEALAGYNRTKKNIIGAAEAMPAEDFSFKPTPEIRSYAELFDHVAQVQTGLCGVISGAQPEHKPALNAATKDEVIAMVKQSFDNCDAAFAIVTDANATEVSGKGFMRGSKVGNIQKDTAHNNEMYGQMVVYMRLKGIVPPSTAMRGHK
ncbi:MAG TPA: DinB family protein [Acidobacteriaceae bacterium]|nr:DinB family protein [Acidobacteriaceae bacterium]